jgi:hypothetical protein
MKKIIILLSLFISVNLQAQTWKGIKLGEKLQPTLTTLAVKGYKPEMHSQEHFCHVYKNAKGEEVLLFYTPKSKIVSKIVVNVEKRTSYHDIMESYAKYKELLGKKYIYEGYEREFDYPYNEGDGFELNALKLGKARIATTYYSDSNGTGMIMIQVASYSAYEAKLAIHYENNKAQEIYMREVEEIKLNKL